MKFLKLLFSVVLVLAATAAAAAQDDYPSRPIKIITTTSAGGLSDIFMRALGEVNYSLLVGNALREGGRTSFVLCVLGETILFGLVGGAVIWAADGDALIWGLGFGLVALQCCAALARLWMGKRDV